MTRKPHRKPRRNKSEGMATLIVEIRRALIETKKVIAENKTFIEHSRDSLVQITSIETSLIRVFKPMQETIDRHTDDVLTMKSRLDRLEAVVKTLDPNWEVAPIC